MVKWRLLKLETHDAFLNMAIDEAIMTERINGHIPNTVRLFSWNPSAVSIGKFQSIDKEAHVEHCKAFGVQMVRRPSGGGSVYHDVDGEVTYSIVGAEADLGGQDITEIYAKVYAGLTEALKKLGITADFSQGDAKKCPNLTVKGKKISGSAQCHRKNVVLQHGTLLVDIDLERMFTFLRTPWSDSCIQAADVAKRKITSIKSEIGDVSTQEVSQALIRGFSQALNAELVQGAMTSRELELAQELCTRKYATEDWNIRGETR